MASVASVRGRPRSAPEVRAGRLEELLRAAIRVFSRCGYRRAQMADVAREMGVSAGTVYNYVESKEALFHLLVERGFAVEATPPDVLPVPTPPPGATLELLRRRLIDEFRVPALETALARRRVGDARAELEAVVRDIYRSVASHREGIVLLERSAVEWPELAALFYQGMRRDYLGRIEQYLHARIRSGHLRRVPDVTAAARLVNETIAWMAMHRHGDADSVGVTDESAEATTVDMLVHALVKE
jgi:AcrR family transcriptional regulator